MILAIHTATEKITIALIKNGAKLDGTLVQGETRQTEKLVAWIETLLKQNNAKPADLKAIGICKGPGAFTGLRLAMVTAKTFAMTLKIPLYGFSLFEGLARELVLAGVKEKVMATFYACRGQVNNALIDLKADWPQINMQLAQDEKEFFSNLPTVDGFVGDLPEGFPQKIISCPASAVGIGLLTEAAYLNQIPTQLNELQLLYSHEPNIKWSNKPELAKLRQPGA
jgi:tRNA threonylcarbamoyl adenosine modification protein YeaZ